jgi:hypothetical protein
MPVNTMAATRSIGRRPKSAKARTEGFDTLDLKQAKTLLEGLTRRTLRKIG